MDGSRAGRKGYICEHTHMHKRKNEIKSRKYSDKSNMNNDVDNDDRKRLYYEDGRRFLVNAVYKVIFMCVCVRRRERG